MFILGVIDNSPEPKITHNTAKLLHSKKLKVNLIEEFESKGGVINNFVKYIEIIKSNTDILIINITKDGIKKEYYNDIIFDTIIYSNSECDGIKAMQKNKLQLSDNSYIIVNIDDDNYSKFLDGVNGYIITYGFNTKATVTASSIDDSENRVSICQQRTIQTIFDNEIEPHELIINIDNCSPQNIYSALAVVAAGLVFNVERKMIAEEVY